jgi:hypothetical protein
MSTTIVPASRMISHDIGSYGYRNKITNGDMRINQRYATTVSNISALGNSPSFNQYLGDATTAPNTQYTVDRWCNTARGGAETSTDRSKIVATHQRYKSLDPDFLYMLQIKGSTNNCTYYDLTQRIESWDSACLGGKTVTLSFYASSTTLNKLTCQIAYANKQDSFISQTVVATGDVNINNSFKRYSITFDLPASAPMTTYLKAGTTSSNNILFPNTGTPKQVLDSLTNYQKSEGDTLNGNGYPDNSFNGSAIYTSGNWYSSDNVHPVFANEQYTLKVGKSQTVTLPATVDASNGVSVSIILPNGLPISQFFNITGVQLEIGPVATPFEHRPYQTELITCHRFFETSYSTDVPVRAANAETSAWTYIPTTARYYNIAATYKVTKRVRPNVRYFDPVTGTEGWVRSSAANTYYYSKPSPNDIGFEGFSSQGFTLQLNESLGPQDIYMCWSSDAEIY